MDAKGFPVEGACRFGLPRQLRELCPEHRGARILWVGTTRLFDLAPSLVELTSASEQGGECEA